MSTADSGIITYCFVTVLYQILKRLTGTYCLQTVNSHFFFSHLLQHTQVRKRCAVGKSRLILPCVVDSPGWDAAEMMALHGWNGRKLIVCFHTFMTAKVTSGKTMRMHADAEEAEEADKTTLKHENT